MLRVRGIYESKAGRSNPLGVSESIYTDIRTVFAGPAAATNQADFATHSRLSHSLFILVYTRCICLFQTDIVGQLDVSPVRRMLYV